MGLATPQTPSSIPAHARRFSLGDKRPIDRAALAIPDLEHLDDPPPEDVLAALSALERRLISLSPAFARVLTLKYHYGRHPAVDAHFQRNRESALTNRSDQFLNQFHQAFDDINADSGRRFGGNRVKNFLDMGCSPGGFSSWLLEHNPGASGVGVTLPDDQAMYDMVLRVPAGRYRVEYADIVQIASDALHSDLPPTIPQAAPSSSSDVPSYDFVIAGAFPTLERQVRAVDRKILALSQLLIILTNLAPGGSCMMVINTKPRLWIIEIIALLRRMFGDVVARKGHMLHLKRSSCYLVANDFRRDACGEAVLSKLQDALRALEEEHKMIGLPADPEDGYIEDVCSPTAPSAHYEEKLLFTEGTPEDVFESEHGFVLQLFEPLWTTQFQAIKDDFERKLGLRPNHRPSQFLTPPPSPTRTRKSSDARAFFSSAHCSGSGGGSRPSSSSASDMGIGMGSQSPSKRDVTGPGSLPSPPASPRASAYVPPHRRLTSSDMSDPPAGAQTARVNFGHAHVQPVNGNMARGTGMGQGHRRARSDADQAMSWRSAR